MQSPKSLNPDLEETLANLNLNESLHINDLPRELLIEIFREIKFLRDRHNAMLTCKLWYDLLQDACFIHTCPEILSIKYYEITADCELIKIFYESTRKFYQLRLDCLYWSENDGQLLEQFFRHLGREARIGYYPDDVEWEDFLSCFPQMIEIRVDTLETLTPYTEFGAELRSVVVKYLDPNAVDLSLPIFRKIKSLKSPARFNIVPDNEGTSGLNILPDDHLKYQLSKFCDLNDIKIVTTANLLSKEPLSVNDIVELVISVPVQILIENLHCFTNLQKLTVAYDKDPYKRTIPCKFTHTDTRCPSIKKVSFQVPSFIYTASSTDFCQTCFETMLKSFPNLRSLKLEGGQYFERSTYLTLIAKYCPDLKVLKLLHRLSYQDHAIVMPDGSPILGLLKNLTKVHLTDLRTEYMLDELQNWPALDQVKDVEIFLDRFPRDLSSWKTILVNSPNIRKLNIQSRYGGDSIPSHMHIKEIVKGLEHLQELKLGLDKLTPESLEPIFTYNRTLKSISFLVSGKPKSIFKLEPIFELFKRIPCLETFTLKFSYYGVGYTEKSYYTFRHDYQSPRDHLSELIYQYEDRHATMAYIRTFLMPHDFHKNSLASEDLSDVNSYLGVNVEEILNNPSMIE